MEPRIERFSRILKLRENARETEQIALAEERREEDAVLRRLDLLGNEKSKALANFCGCGAAEEKAVSLQEIWFQRQAIDVIEKRIDKSRENLSDVQRRIEGTEARLKEKHRDVRLMEGYVDRLRTDVHKLTLEAEQIELDDIAVTRYRHAAVQAVSQNSGARRYAQNSQGAGRGRV
jgi:flagellar export protein FliJ